MKFDDDGMTECPVCKGLGYESRFGDDVPLEETVYYDAREEAYEEAYDKFSYNKKKDGLSDLTAEELDKIVGEYGEKNWRKFTLDALEGCICWNCRGTGLVDWISRIM